MYEFIREKRLFDKWGLWCLRENDVHWFLGVNEHGYPRRSALDRIGESGERAGVVKYGHEAKPKDYTDMHLISRLMEAWSVQMPRVHRALMMRHRDQTLQRRAGLVLKDRRGADRERAFAFTGDATPAGVRTFYDYCEAGYRILHVNMRPDIQDAPMYADGSS